MASCAKCSKKIERNSVKVNCSSCGKIFHCLCVNITSTDLEFLKNQSKTWNCSSCQKEKKAEILKSSLECSMSGSSDTDSKFDLILNKIDELHKGSMDNAASLNNLTKRLETLSNLLENVVAENKALKQQISVLEERCDKAEHFAHKSFVDFVNIPMNNNDTIANNIVNFVKNSMNINITADDIDFAYKKTFKKSANNNDLPNNSSSNKNNNSSKLITSVITVKFLRSSIAANIIKNKNKWKKRLTNAADNNIYINEWMSSYKRSILAAARRKKYELKFKYLWTRNGYIYMKAAAGSNVKCIKNLDDLQKLT